MSRTATPVTSLFRNYVISTSSIDTTASDAAGKYPPVAILQASHCYKTIFGAFSICIIVTFNTLVFKI
ncbi:MAG: hypothetical protein ICV56_07910 [Nitrososphaeraceae archaeon]|nr:hypothetical protein [Nitrososphaeraceae archaeon]